MDPLCDIDVLSITKLATVGFGDLHPVNLTEMNCVTFYMLFNLGMTAYLIGNMTNLVVHATSKTRAFVSKSLTILIQQLIFRLFVAAELMLKVNY